jgi:dTDP-4-amino-4,6-dideoxygalactose transaminase
MTNSKNKKILVGDIRFSDRDKDIVMQLLDSGRISEGKKVVQFEKQWADIIGTQYTVLVNSGTSALICGLEALIQDPRFPKIKRGAKVITSPITYVATSNAVKLVGMKPVYADIDPVTFAITPESIEEILNSDTVEDYCMILPVHLMGYPCEMDKINDIAKKYGLAVMEDSSQAHGSKYKSKNVGTYSLL